MKKRSPLGQASVLKSWLIAGIYLLSGSLYCRVKAAHATAFDTQVMDSEGRAVIQSAQLQSDIPRLTIEKVASEQLPGGAEYNYLPAQRPNDLAHSGGAGRVGNRQQVMLMGARKDNRGYLKVKCSINPDLPELWSKVKLQVAHANDPNKKLLGAPAVLDTPDRTSAYLVVDLANPAQDLAGFVVGGWLDLNDNDRLDASEVLETPKGVGVIRIISQEQYQDAVRWMAAGVALMRGTYPIAADFLGGFVQGIDLSLMSQKRASTVHPNGELDFNVGAQFDSNGLGSVWEYEFSTDSVVSQAVSQSWAMREAVTITLNRSHHEIQRRFTADPDLNEIRFPIQNAAGVDQLHFSQADPDLFLAFGTAVLKATVTVYRGQTQRVWIAGELNDLYDWNYEAGTLEAQAAMIQAGYPTLGNGGQVFKLRSFFSAALDGIRTNGQPGLTIHRLASSLPGSLRATINGQTGATYMIESSVDLKHWQDETLVTLKSPTEMITLAKPFHSPHSFYRMRMMP